jgi:ataxia telangiectasia mutated family protein
MLNSVRDEILVFIFSVHLHLERCVIDDETGDMLSLMEELADTFRADYAKRKEDEMLLLDHLNMEEFGGAPINASPFRLHTFNLMSHNSRSERLWAILQAIGVFEHLVALGHQRGSPATNDEEDEEEKHPRKRQRVTQNPNRLLDPLQDENVQTRTAGLQWIPFVLEESQLSPVELRELLALLIHCVSDKRAKIASWALLAVARYLCSFFSVDTTDVVLSCTKQEAITELGGAECMQLWHAGARALTFSTTCRSASLLLHTLIAKNLVQYQDISEDVNSMISAFDTNGPLILCDSSIFLMSHLLHARVSEAPGASLAASQNVIRWMFARWNPGTVNLDLGNFCADMK